MDPESVGPTGAVVVPRASASTVRDCAHRLPPSDGQKRRLGWVLAITCAFLVVETAAGWFAHSLALLADAGHMLTDAGALGLAVFAAWLARRPATRDRTYGYVRIEILAALANGAALFVIAGLIVWDATRRLAAPPAVEPRVVVGVGALGLVVNVVAARILHGGRDHSLNVRGAYLHVLGDLLGSLGAIVAGVVILATGWRPADPLVSIVIALLILVGAWGIVRESADVLLEATPRHIALDEVEREIVGIPGVAEVHDLHVWTLTSGVVAMSGHAIVADLDRHQQVLEAVQERMARFGIRHVTMQIERDSTCPPAVGPDRLRGP
jgi:cobalt-zinc-cadmium efflux system protein